MKLLVLGKGKTGSIVAEIAKERGHEVISLSSVENVGAAARSRDQAQIVQDDDDHPSEHGPQDQHAEPAGARLPLLARRRLRATLRLGFGHRTELPELRFRSDEA